jgi:hypothetical protein
MTTALRVLFIYLFFLIFIITVSGMDFNSTEMSSVTYLSTILYSAALVFRVDHNIMYNYIIVLHIMYVQTWKSVKCVFVQKLYTSKSDHATPPTRNIFTMTPGRH